MNTILTFDQVITVNRMLEPLRCKLHLSDACGGQSLWLEKLEGSKPDETALRLVEDWFAAEGTPLKRLSDGVSFRAVE